MPLLKKNDKLKTNITKSECKIVDFIGSGGQGEVYRARYKGKDVAVKWYYKHTATVEQKKILEALIKEGTPNESFMWPIEIVEPDGGSAPKSAAAGVGNGFGYIMTLRPPEYKVMVSVMNRSADPSFFSLITAALRLADSFFKLHAKGLCYRDISYNNIFIEPKTGSILICDNDNVTYNNVKCGTILGTPKFMAPEVVTRKSLPNQYTDLYSLAILLFYLLFISHPLEGELEYNIKCLDVPAMNRLYGENPVFIFDPKNASNRPVPGAHDNANIYWALYPDFIKKAFMQSFTDGIKDPENGRVRETIWRGLLLKLRSHIVYCTCGAENFYAQEKLKSGIKCWACGASVSLPPRLKIGGEVIMLNYDTRLYKCQLDKADASDLDTLVAEVVRHPSNPGIWGLKNVSGGDIFAETSDGEIKTVPPGKSATLSEGLTINFGKAKGTVKV